MAEQETSSKFNTKIRLMSIADPLDVHEGISLIFGASGEVLTLLTSHDMGDYRLISCSNLMGQGLYALIDTSWTILPTAWPAPVSKICDIDGPACFTEVNLWGLSKKEITRLHAVADWLNAVVGSENWHWYQERTGAWYSGDVSMEWWHFIDSRDEI